MNGEVYLLYTVNFKIYIYMYYISVPGSPIGTSFISFSSYSSSLNLKKASVITCGMLWTLIHYFLACPALRNWSFKSHLLGQQQDCLEVTAPSIDNRPRSEPLGVVRIGPRDNWSGMHTGKPKKQTSITTQSRARAFPPDFPYKRDKGGENRLIFDELVLFRGVLSF